MNPARTRIPAVAGYFYPADKDELFESIHRCFTHSLGPGRYPSRDSKPKEAIDSGECFVAPHAGYEYSGPVAAHTYGKIHDFFSRDRRKNKIAIILGPNHQGIGSGVALSPAESWSTPLGESKVDERLSKEISECCDLADFDEIAHVSEHSIEVQIPFLQAVCDFDRLTFVPICLMLQDHETTKQLADALLKVIKANLHDCAFAVIGSSDLTHYENKRSANQKDLRLLAEVSKLDVLGYYSILERFNVTACGYGAISTAMLVAKGLGKKSANVLKYATSGDLTGDISAVVGYSAVQFA